MKFGKEFTSQMIPEWHEMYMDYNHLKKLLKQINSFKEKNSQIGSQHSSGQKMELALYRAFSGLTLRQQPRPDIENPVISVDSVKGDGFYETRFLKVEEEGAEYELVYFRRLDDEFNKVLKFYSAKVEEVMGEAAKLEKQMHALVGFRIKVEKPYEWFDGSSVGTRFASDNELSVSAPSAPSPSWEESSRQGGRISIDIQDGTTSRQEASDESGDDTDAEEIKPMKKNKLNDEEQLKIKNEAQENTIPSSPLEILERVKINISRETPKATIKALLNVPKQTELKFDKENFKQAEELLKRAFVEYYHKLRLLKSYSFINMLAFSKIMKKYDKITSRNASKSYLKMVESSFQTGLSEVNMLMERVEVTFIKHFSNSNRSKGMQILRLKPKRERHRITFSLGLFVGCAAALIVALILIIRARDILQNSAKGSQYMNTMFPLYSLFGFFVLHMIMYSGNIYFWKRYRVNYSFIFGLKPGTEIGYRDVLYLSFGLAVLALIGVLSNLDLEMDPKTNDYKAITELVPLILVGVIIGVLICPFNILYRSSRYFFIKCIFRCVCVPLYTVTLADCIMADQLTSQVQAFRSLEFYICYYGWGDYRHRENTCNTSHSYNTFSFIIAAIPFGIRLLQNVRLMYQQNLTMWGYNALKYFATIVAVCTRTAYSLDDSTSWEVVAWITSAFAAIFCTYWDLVIDWGLLDRHSKNRWLRDKLVIPHKSVYYGAMVLNVLLRFAWLQTVLNFKISSLHTQALVTIVASLEIIRRGIWNFFRLENEHLNNVSKFRAFKSVPLPFNYDEDEEKDD